MRRRCLAWCRYEVPIGLMAKLQELSTERFFLEFLIDDSGSMRTQARIECVGGVRRWALCAEVVARVACCILHAECCMSYVVLYGQLGLRLPLLALCTRRWNDVNCRFGVR